MCSTERKGLDLFGFLTVVNVIVRGILLLCPHKACCTSPNKTAIHFFNKSCTGGIRVCELTIDLLPGKGVFFIDLYYMVATANL